MLKKNLLCVLISALIALGLPFLAVSFVRSDAGMAVCFLLFFAVNPLTAVLLGVFSGLHLRRAWFQILLFPALFLLGTQLLFAPGERAFLLYAAIYLAIGCIAMAIASFAAGRKKKAL